MSEPCKTYPSTGTMLLTFLAGAAAGAVVVALTTPKTGPQCRHELRNLGRRAKLKAGDVADSAHGAWDDLKLRAGFAAREAEQDLTDLAEKLKA